MEPQSAKGKGNIRAIPQLKRGDIVHNFEVARLIGRGGMGEVYLARDVRLGRKVALKVMRGSVASEEARRRFLLEAQATAQFNHPNIVTIYGVGEFRDRFYVALEYLEGQTLRQRMEEARLSVRQAARIGLAVAKALCEAHRHRILHRDLKPENVVLTRDGRVRVLDFGLATLALPEAEQHNTDKHTLGEAEVIELRPLAAKTLRPSRLKGTPQYMAPEQWLQLPCSEKTDTWALGLMLYELVAETRPFRSKSLPELAREVTEPDPVSLDGLPQATHDGLTQLIGLCLRKDPVERPNAAEIADRLGTVLSAGRPVARGRGTPFRGLLPFTEREAEFFFGRHDEISAFVERLRHEPIVTVVGPSGAGKSSFVQAGVIPRLREQGDWQLIHLRPGRRPLQALAAALRTAERCGGEGHSTYDLAQVEGSEEAEDPEQAAARVAELVDQLQDAPARLSLRLDRLAERQQCRVLLFVDQLEELYTLVDDPWLRRRFMEAVCTAADNTHDPVRVVFTLRDDFLGKVAEGPVAREALSRIMAIRAPGEQALAEILVKPIETLGYSYDDPSLVTEMVQAVKGEPACLPLLQFATQVLWEGRDTTQRKLLRRIYDLMGGIAGALARQADSFLDNLSPQHVKLARGLLLRLVTPEGTRRVVARGELLANIDPQASRVLDRLTAERIVTAHRGDSSDPDETELELVHESLLETWRTMKRWLEESREELSFLSQANQAAQLWQKRGCRDEELWQGDALAEAVRQLNRCTTEVPSRVSQFISAGQQKRRRHSRHKRGLVAAGFIAITLIAAAFGAKEREAQRQRERAERQAAAAESGHAQAQREGARSAFLRGERLEARAKLRTLLESRDSVMARLLWWKLAQDPLLWKRQLGTTIYAVDYSTDARFVAAASADTAVYLFDARTSAIHHIFRGLSEPASAVAISPDRRWIAAGSWSGKLAVWDIHSGKLVHEPAGHTREVWTIRFSPDSKQFATASADRFVRIWRTTDGKPLHELRGHSAGVFGVSYGPHGRRLATGSEDKTIRVWVLPEGKPLMVLRGHSAAIRAVSFSPDGKFVASGSYDHSVRLWEWATGATVRIYDGHSAPVRTVAFSPDGRALASGSRDATVRIWNVKSGEQTNQFDGHRASVRSVAFSPDGGNLASGGRDGALHVWRVGRRLGQLAKVSGTHTAEIRGIGFSPDGKQIATGSLDRTVRLWSVESGKQKRVFEGHDAEVLGVDFSPDGRFLATGSSDHTVRVWDMRDDGRVRLLLGHRDGVLGVTFSSKGDYLATSSFDKTVRVWDTRTWQVKWVLRGHGARVRGVSFSPDGRRLASGSADQTVRIWDVASGEHVQTLRGHTAGIWGVTFSPNGQQLATTGEDQTVRLWDLEQRRSNVLTKLSGRGYWLAFHPDGRHLGVPLSNGTTQLWHWPSKQHRVLPSHLDAANYVRFTPDGKLVATSSDDGTVRLWNAATGRPHWYAPALISSPPRLLSHRGWSTLATDAIDAAPDTDKPAWQAAIEHNSRFVAEAGASLCIATFDDTLEYWDRREDRRLWQQRVPKLARLIALRDGCLTLAAGQVRLHRHFGSVITLAEANATAIAWRAPKILIAIGDRVTTFLPTGRRTSSVHIDPGITAITPVANALIVGFSDGNIERVTLKRPGSRLNYEGVPSSSVERLMTGPRGTLIGGYANGFLGIWDATTGERIEHTRLPGRLVHLLLENGRLYAGTDLGHTLNWDLSVLYADYCKLLDQVWRRVPVTWGDGHAVLQGRPRQHRCQS